MDAAPWAISGSYLEACNCEAICPCRRIDGKAGGRSTYGECTGALSWIVEEGRAGDVDLADMRVVITCRYHDDEPGSPWIYLLLVDARGSEAQRQALSDIFTGRLGGTATKQFPWAFKESELLGVEAVGIERQQQGADHDGAARTEPALSRCAAGAGDRARRGAG
ncbi:MAG: hypothetical protein QOG15_1628 [Solirubrobacteraceae bacterium]|nr:hypothetical protein [Solirubrobacteraceae bacterium]